MSMINYRSRWIIPGMMAAAAAAAANLQCSNWLKMLKVKNIMPIKVSGNFVLFIIFFQEISWGQTKKNSTLFFQPNIFPKSGCVCLHVFI